MARKTLLIDMDGIIVDFVPYWLSEYNFLSGESITFNQITHWNISKFVQNDTLLQSIMHFPGAFTSPLPKKGAIEYLTKIIKKRKRYKVVIVTQIPRKSNYALTEKRMWMEKYFPDFDTTYMVFTHKKYLIRGDVFFDDNPEHLKLWQERSKVVGQIAVTFDYPYNQEAKVDHRINTWQEFYEIVENL